MKQYLKIYLKYILFILLSLFITSLIIAFIISFIHIPSIVYYIIINLLAIIIMIAWGILIVKTTNNAIVHSLICGLIFGIIACMCNINNLNMINIISRPMILIITVLLITHYRKKLES